MSDDLTREAADTERDDDPATDLPAAQRDFYQRLRARVHDYAESRAGKADRFLEIVMLVPDLFHLLVRLSFDPRVPLRSKLLLGAAAAYIVLPLDVLPELLLGTGGFVEDVAVGFAAIHTVLETTDPEIVRGYWAGPGELLDTVQRVLDRTRSVLAVRGVGTRWGLLQRVVDRVTGPAPPTPPATAEVAGDDAGQGAVTPAKSSADET